MLRTTSPISDPILQDPLAIPDAQQIADKDVDNENQFASLGASQRYPEIVAQLRSRQDFYRKYMPDGKALIELSNEEAGAWWKCAATIIQEIEGFINIIEVNTDAVRKSRGR